MLKFAVNLKYLREQKQLNQSEIAADMGFSFQKWNNYERNVSRPGWEDLIKISKYFGILESDLMHLHLENYKLNDIYDNYKNHNNHKLNYKENYKPYEQKTPNYTMAHEPEATYGNANTGDQNIHLLLTAKDDLIESLRSEINTLQSALSFAKTTIELLKNESK